MANNPAPDPLILRAVMAMQLEKQELAEVGGMASATVAPRRDRGTDG